MLPLPEHYDPERLADWSYAADIEGLRAEAGRFAAAHAIPPAGEDRRRSLLLLVDLQRDFCLPAGALFVAGRSGDGAVADNRRLVEFLYRNLSAITETVVTLDSHLPHQIFFPAFWVDADGRPLQPHRTVSVEQIAAGEARPRPGLAAWLSPAGEPWLREQVEDYCRRLEDQGRYSLYLWPPHCLLGSPGHCLAGVVEEARLFHAFARGAEAAVEVKGTFPLTEHYSVLRPEVVLAHDGRLIGEGSEALVSRLLAADRVVVAGQAASHCVRSTLEDLLELLRDRAPDRVERVWILEDCMSAVTVPDGAGGYAADFTEEARAALERCREAGMNVVRSTLGMQEWG